MDKQNINKFPDNQYIRTSTIRFKFRGTVIVKGLDKFDKYKESNQLKHERAENNVNMAFIERRTAFRNFIPPLYRCSDIKYIIFKRCNCWAECRLYGKNRHSTV